MNTTDLTLETCEKSFDELKSYFHEFDIEDKIMVI